MSNERLAERVYIALGSNQARGGDAPATIVESAMERLAAVGTVARRSQLFASRAWPDPSGPAYVNAAAQVETDLPPQALLARLLEIENAFGRERRARWAARTLDLDILDYAGRVGSFPQGGEGPPLTLPHPRMARRLFVLRPLADIAPDWRRPKDGRAIADLIAEAEPETEAWPLS